jgi:hypothetical protein
VAQRQRGRGQDLDLERRARRALAHLAGVAEAAVEVVLVHPIMEVTDPDGLVLLLPGLRG